MIRTLLSFAIVHLLANSAIAYDRHVIINGSRASPSDLALLDMIHGEYIPNGMYWLNYETGE